MHLTMCTTANSKVSSLEDTYIIKQTPENDAIYDSPHNKQLDTNDNINDASSSDDMELINADGRHSSATFIIDAEKGWEDIVDNEERERLARENCDVGDEDELSDNDDELKCYTSHIPIDNDNKFLRESPYSNEHFGASVPTPIQLGIKDILNDDMDKTQDIKQKKYAVLPSIGKTFEEPKNEVEPNDSDPTINQLDYTREKMETEADFFADYRVNTSVVKPTPRNVPLPPIGQTFSPRSLSRESS